MPGRPCAVSSTWVVSLPIQQLLQSAALAVPDLLERIAHGHVHADFQSMIDSNDIVTMIELTDGIEGDLRYPDRLPELDGTGATTTFHRVARASSLREAFGCGWVFGAGHFGVRQAVDALLFEGTGKFL